MSQSKDCFDDSRDKPPNPNAVIPRNGDLLLQGRGGQSAGHVGDDGAD